LVTAYIDGQPGSWLATTKHAISEHDVVVLRLPVGAWPAGTTGSVISAYDDTLLVEITGPGGKTLDTVQVPAATRIDVKHA
jgi:predicted dinucleotide-binding enzyme